MRLLAVTIAVGLALTGCASNEAGSGSGGPSTSSAGASGASGSLSPTGSTTSSVPGGTSSSVPSGRPTGSASGLCPTRLNLGQYNGPHTRVLPADFKVSWVLRCSIVPLVGSRRQVVTERSDSDPSRLLEALRAPSAPKSEGVCPLMRMLVPYFALVDPNGHAVAPKIPLTGCGLPQAAVVQALNDLHFTVLSKQRVP